MSSSKETDNHESGHDVDYAVEAQSVAPIAEPHDIGEPSSNSADYARMLSSFITSRLGLPLALVLLTLGTFANSLSGDFIHDDVPQIKANSLFGHWDLATISRPFTHDHWSALRQEQAADRVDSNYYRPVFGLFLLSGYEIAGRDPVRWHILLLLLHSAAAVLLFLVVDRSLASATELEPTRRSLMAAGAAAIFAVHPAQSESVAWISGSVNSLSTIFFLAAFCFYLSYRRDSTRQLVKAAAAIILFALSTLTKENALTFVAVVAAYELLVLNRNQSLAARIRMSALHAAPYALVAAGYLALRFSVLKVLSGRNRNANFPDDALLTIADNLRTLPALLLAYLKIAVFPFNLSFIYGFGYVRTAGLASFWVPLVLLAAFGLLLVTLSRRMPEIKIAAIWMAIPLLPHLSTLTFASEEIIHDRYLYISLAGVGLLVAALISAIQRGSHLPRQVAVAAALLILIILCVGASLRNSKWRDEQSLWSDAAVHAPNSRMVRVALGYLAEARGDLPRALDEYESALRIDPDMIDALNNAAFVNARLGAWPDATAYFERIAGLTPEKAVAHFNLSFAYAVQKRYHDASREQLRAIELDPDGPRAAEWRARLTQLEATQQQPSNTNTK